jgi:glutathione synthase/RimK-type ligase-like ATP-grasp enzyme
MKAVILYENPDWLPPFANALRDEGIPFEPRFVHKGAFALHEPPEPAVYVNRMSASSDTRGHGEGLVLASHILQWVEGYGLPVVNGSNALSLEVSKVRQYSALARAGISVPETRVVVGGRKELLVAAQEPELRFPCVYKYNRGGKGAGVVLLRTRLEFERFVNDSGIPEASPDGTHLIQRYVAPGRGLCHHQCDRSDGSRSRLRSAVDPRSRWCNWIGRKER